LTSVSSLDMALRVY